MESAIGRRVAPVSPGANWTAANAAGVKALGGCTSATALIDISSAAMGSDVAFKIQSRLLGLHPGIFCDLPQVAMGHVVNYAHVLSELADRARVSGRGDPEGVQQGFLLLTGHLRDGSSFRRSTSYAWEPAAR